MEEGHDKQTNKQTKYDERYLHTIGTKWITTVLSTGLFETDF